MAVIWALARQTILQAFRMKAAVLLIALFLLTGALLPFALEADATQTGEVKVILIYNLTVATGLLTALSVLLSARVLDSEIEGKQIYLLASKPVPRHALLLGKWLGVVLLVAWLLLLLGAATFASAYAHARFDIQRPDEFQQIRQEVLTSRASIRPAIDTGRLTEAVQRYWIAEGFSPQELDTPTVRTLIEREVERKSLRVPPGGMLPPFELEGLPVSETAGASYTLRFKLYGVDDGNFLIHSYWRLYPPDRSRFTELLTESKAGETREVRFPAAAVSGDGRMVIEYRNVTFGDPGAELEANRQAHTVALSTEEGLELLAPRGSFLLNFLRALLLLWIRLAAIAAIGVAASAFLHFPVAVLLLAGFVIPYGYGAPFLQNYTEKLSRKIHAEAAIKSDAHMPEAAAELSASALGMAAELYRTGITVIAALPPRFDNTDPVDDLVAGREIPWRRVARQCGVDLLLRGGLALAAGLWLLRRRQLGLPEG